MLKKQGKHYMEIPKKTLERMNRAYNKERLDIVKAEMKTLTKVFKAYEKGLATKEDYKDIIFDIEAILDSLE